jgi:hypothetical protein
MSVPTQRVVMSILTERERLTLVYILEKPMVTLLTLEPINRLSLHTRWNRKIIFSALYIQEMADKHIFLTLETAAAKVWKTLGPGKHDVVYENYLMDELQPYFDMHSKNDSDPHFIIEVHSQPSLRPDVLTYSSMCNIKRMYFGLVSRCYIINFGADGVEMTSFSRDPRYTIRDPQYI